MERWIGFGVGKRRFLDRKTPSPVLGRAVTVLYGFN
jgi:hypothetical protein